VAPLALDVTVETFCFFDFVSGARCSSSSKFPLERLRLTAVSGDALGMFDSRKGVGGLRALSVVRVPIGSEEPREYGERGTRTYIS